MKKVLPKSLLFPLLLLPAIAVASDYQTPNLFTAGEVISADALNENFEQLAAVMRPVTTDALLGRWSCQGFITPEVPMCTGDWAPTGQFLKSLTETVVFSNPSPMTYTVTTEGKDLFTCSNSGTPTSSFEVLGGSLFLRYDPVGGTGGPYTAGFNLRRQSTTQVRWDRIAGGSFQPLFVICDKLDLPPSRPTGLSGDPSGASVTLTWTDASSDETSFVILRRDSLGSDFVETATAPANATSYTDQSLAPGTTYWYRVKARNAFGDSFGSNLIRVSPVQPGPADAGIAD
jgi:Fibronectin type III domain